MKKRISMLVAGGALVAGFGLGGGGVVSAAHCTDNGPGHSDFGKHHVQVATHDEGFHRGWSSCIPGNPNQGYTRP